LLTIYFEDFQSGTDFARALYSQIRWGGAMTADEYRKFENASAKQIVRELHRDRGTWGLTLFLVCVTFWIVVLDIYRLFF
jgi:hypothetical protein